MFFLIMWLRCIRYDFLMVFEFYLMFLIIMLNVKYLGFFKEKLVISDILFDVCFMVLVVFFVDFNVYYIFFVFVSV